MAEENNTTTTKESGTSAEENNQGNNTQSEGQADNGTAQQNSGAKVYTQDEINAMIEKRLARERKKYQNQQNSNTAESSTENTVTGTTQTVEVDVTEDARTQAAAIIAQANQRLIQAIAQTEAAKLNINPDYIADAVKLADLSTVKVGEDGTVDSKSIVTALEAVVNRMPVLKATTETPAGNGFKVGGQGGTKSQTNGWGSTSKNSGEVKRWNKNRY